MNGYFDLQVNGYGGVDFNATGVRPDRFRVACEALRRDGVDGILATVITAPMEQMATRIQAIVHARDSDPLVADVIQGIHVEGPFLNEQPGFIGAHPVAAARPANPGDMQRLLEAGAGWVRLVTLAPERDPGMMTIRMLADQNVCVAAGHCDPSLDQLDAAIDAGLRLFTHLGNACPAQLPRHDNIIQRVLNRAAKGRLKISLIADGAHLPLYVLWTFLHAAGTAQCLVVTDAIAAAGLGPGTYTLGGQQVEIGDDLIPWSADRSHFVGSATTMKTMQHNLRSIGVDDAGIGWLLSDGPKSMVGLTG